MLLVDEQSQGYVFESELNETWFWLVVNSIVVMVFFPLVIVMVALTESNEDWVSYFFLGGVTLWILLFVTNSILVFVILMLKRHNPVQYVIGQESIEAWVRGKCVAKIATKEVVNWHMDIPLRLVLDMFTVGLPSIFLFPKSEPPRLDITIRSAKGVEWVKFPRLLYFSPDKYEQILMAMESVTGMPQAWGTPPEVIRAR